MDSVRSATPRTVDFALESVLGQLTLNTFKTLAYCRDRAPVDGIDASVAEARAMLGNAVESGHAKLQAADAAVDLSLALVERGALTALGTLVNLRAGRPQFERVLRASERELAR